MVCYKNCLFVFVIVVFNLSHFSHGLIPSTYAVFSPFASCDSVRKNIQDTSHVICYRHFLLSVSCALALCRYIVQEVVQKVNEVMFGEILVVCIPYASFKCLHIHSEYVPCCIPFIVINNLKLQQISEFRLFLFKYEAGFKISVLLFR